MLNFALQLVLLLAIATSQILGGVSCCCLGRSVAALDALYNTSATAASAASPEIKHARKPACSKCTQRNHQKSRPTSIAVVIHTCHGNASDINDECRCQQVEPNACSPTIAVAPARCLTSFAYESLLTQPTDTAATRTSKADVPCRIGRHSWQAIACIWTN